MLLTITHRTDYRYDAPVGLALSRLRLHPRSGPTQTVRDWSVTVENGSTATTFTDHFGNTVHLAEIARGATAVHVVARGTVETHDTHGVVGAHGGPAPLWLFLQQTPLTTAGKGVAALVAEVGADDSLSRLHRLMGAVADRVRWREDSSEIDTSAEEALAQGEGVCQDQAHAFIAAARAMAIPARYVSGYLRMGDAAQAASHAWAEAHVEGLGWVGFDVANRVCPDARHVRLAVGRDYSEAAPISGLRYGAAAEVMDVALTVEAAGTPQQ